MAIVLSAFSLLVASAACGLALAVALRVKKLLDPLTEEGALGSRRRFGVVPEAGETIPQTPPLNDVDGRIVEFPDTGSGPWVLTFQAVGCSGCKEQLPVYKKFLRDTGLGKERAFSVVTGDAEGLPFYREELSDVCRVVPGSEAAADLVKSLGISVFPTYILVGDDGTVAFSSQSSARLSTSGARFVAPVPTGG
ncbi:hypothetical protein [Streptomyces europaeiscabiei]|uniref:TlpA family protein disulfide reductase n=1 Tax=Streptomyces europaeiscabiei TaxID=146819 RepID=UPI002E162147|nr:thioredoxin family protein [Streptomyces europaeiscabiei]